MKRHMLVSPSGLLTLVFAALASHAIAADSPGKLRMEMAKLEKQYISLYNKLNSNPEFAILCRREAPTGSNVEVRVCQPKYQISSVAMSASQVVQFAQSAGDNTGSGRANNASAGTSAEGEANTDLDMDAAFRQNVLAIQAISPELLALGKKRSELQARQDALTKAPRK